MKFYSKNPLINLDATYTPGDSLTYLTYAHRSDLSEVEDEKIYVVQNMKIAY